MRLLISLGIAAVIAMLLLLQVWLGSWRYAALCLVTPLVAAAGGVLAARIAGDTLSLGSWFGIFAVFGLAMRNGLLLVSGVRRLERDAGESASYAFVLRGSGERLVPVATTAVVTGLVALTFIAFGAKPGPGARLPVVHRRPGRRDRRHGLDAVRRPRPLLPPRRCLRVPARAGARRRERARRA